MLVCGWTYYGAPSAGCFLYLCMISSHDLTSGPGAISRLADRTPTHTHTYAHTNSSHVHTTDALQDHLNHFATSC